MKKPKEFSTITTIDLWNDPHISKYMLEAHLNPTNDAASRNHKFIDRSVDFMINRFNINDKTKLIDFGCGPGLYTSRLSKTGADVTGIDFSVSSITYAKEYASYNNLNINYFNQDYLSYFSNQKYDLITMIYCDFCALSPEQRSILLSKFKEQLKPEGRLFIDVHTMTLHKEFKENSESNHYPHGGFFSPSAYDEIINRFKYDDITLEHYKIISDETKEIFNWLQCYSLDSITNEIATFGFEIEEVFGNVAGDEYNDSLDTMALVIKQKEA